MEINHYEILGISQYSTEEEIKTAYKQLAKKYHPDKNPGNSFYEDHFKKINNAYQILSDKEKRKNFDLKLYYSQQRKNQPSPQQTNNKTSQRTSVNKKKEDQGKTSKEDQKKIRKYTIITVVGFAIFITCALFFYKYMNLKAAQERLAEAKMYEAKKQYLTAIAQYTEAIDYDNKFSEAYIRRANLRIKLFGDFRGAIKDYTSAISSVDQPEYSYYFLRAKSYLKIKDYKEGINDLSSAITINSRIDSLYFYRAEVNNFILKQYDEAIKDYDKLLALNENFKDGKSGRALANQGAGKNEAAIQDFSELISKYPQESSFYYYRGFSKINLKDTSGACKDWLDAELLGFTEAREAMTSYCNK